MSSAYLIPNHLVLKIEREACGLRNLEVCQELRLYADVALDVKNKYNGFRSVYEMHVCAFVVSVGESLDRFPSDQDEEHHLKVLHLFPDFQSIFT